MKVRFTLLFSFCLFLLNLKAQVVSESTFNFNNRESVFTDDLKYVFIIRKENFGNVFVYDVANNTMIKEIVSKSGSVLKVYPYEKYFLLATTNALEVYDVETFGLYYSLPYNYQNIAVKTIKKMEVKSSEYSKETEEVIEESDWNDITVNIGGDFISCKWEDGKIKLWNWKTKNLLLENDVAKVKGIKGEFEALISNISFGTNPTRIFYQDGKKVTLYDSTFKVLGSLQLDDVRTVVNYIDLSNEIMIMNVSMEVKTMSYKATLKIYKEDLSTLLKTSELTYKLGGSRKLEMSVDHGIMGKFSIQENYVYEVDFDKEYLNYNYNNHKIIIIDAYSRDTVRKINGSLSSISPDGKRIIVKMIDGELPEYNVEKYKKFFKKRSSALKGSRYLYKYKKEIDAQTYQRIIDLETGIEINSVKTSSPMYFFKNIYILENSPENGGLKLYDFTTGNLIKEI